jgi:hypothetical protein
VTASRLKQAEVADRRRRLLAALSSGMTIEQIAGADPEDERTAWVAVFGGSPGRVAQEARRALEQAAANDAEIADRYVTLELERLAAAERRVQQILIRASDARDGLLALRAVDRVIRLSERRSELLALNADRSRRNPAGPAPAEEDRDDLARRRAERRSAARLAAAQRG